MMTRFILTIYHPNNYLHPFSFRDRLQSGLERLVNRSRRSVLFGRVIRIPSLFPFRRQEGDKTIEPISQRSRRRRDRRRKSKELDKQMIFINGKQFYVDDDGKLKEAQDEAQTAKS